MRSRGQGWGTALKPSHEPIVVARKPLSERNVAANVLRHGTGGINVDAARIATSDSLGGGAETTTTRDTKGHEGWERPWMDDPEARDAHAARVRANVQKAESLGRWPANVVLVHADGCERVGTKQVEPSTLLTKHELAESENVAMSGKNYARSPRQDYAPDGVEEVEAWECVEGCPVRALDEQSGESLSSGGVYGAFASKSPRVHAGGLRDRGGASRFFYVAKASRLEREAGLRGTVPCSRCGGLDTTEHEIDGKTNPCIRNDHPTVKPVEVMRWLIRLVCPPGGVVLDPFVGSGTTGCAAALEPCVRGFVGIERDEGSARIAEARIGFWVEHGEETLARARAVRAGLGDPGGEDPGPDEPQMALL